MPRTPVDDCHRHHHRSAGDSLYFDSAVGHVYLSLGDTDAEVLACCVDGDTRRPRDTIRGHGPGVAGTRDASNAATRHPDSD